MIVSKEQNISMVENNKDEIAINIHLIWSREWQSTLVLLPGESHGQRSLVGYSPRGRKELGPTERLHFHFQWLDKTPCQLRGSMKILADTINLTNTVLICVQHCVPLIMNK